VMIAGRATSLAVSVPMALYAAGVGLVQPQTMALAMQPFPERAGAASSLLGVLQMSLAALVGVAVGHMLGDSPLPLPAIIAGLGVSAFVVFRASGAGVRAAAEPA